MKITAQAHAQVAKICQPDQFFRVQVLAGGCSGFAQDFQITTDWDPDSDQKQEQVIWDSHTHELLQDAVLDWQCDLSGNKFVLQIPSSTNTCGCGKSFSIF